MDEGEWERDNVPPNGPNPVLSLSPRWITGNSSQSFLQSSFRYRELLCSLDEYRVDLKNMLDGDQREKERRDRDSNEYYIVFILTSC